MLTVRAGAAASHRGKGWAQFTDQIIRSLGAREAPLVFMLWGSFAAAKAAMIKCSSAPDLSSARLPCLRIEVFRVSACFSQCNEFSQYGEADWLAVSPEKAGVSPAATDARAFVEAQFGNTGTRWADAANGSTGLY